MSNRIALVFGGSRGIGAASVQALAANGFDVAYTYVSSAADAGSGQGRVQGYAADIQDAALVEVNIVGAFNVLAEAARQVQDGGSIIALTTSLVRHAAPGLGPYSATKAAVECMVRSMAKELAGRKVRVNAVAPGPVDTDLFRAGKTDEARQRSAAMSPLNRVGEPAEIAEVIAFLASERSSWIDGQIVQPNGGLV
jgi:3-oxoacyl-[acyl-carrier protein] reductase